MTRATQRITRAILLLLALHSTSAATRYVDVNCTHPVPPFTNWATAATMIQHAVDASAPGDEVLVTNGVYALGARQVVGEMGMMMDNRLVVTKPLTVRSVNGPEATVICGYQVPGSINGDLAIRCVYLAGGAVLSGFTLTNGATTLVYNSYGGGVYCESTNAILTNCILIANSASRGGGAYGGTLNHCTLTGNSASYGGGAYGGILNQCTLTGNAAGYGGGAYLGMLNNCSLTNNSASRGGGASSNTLNNCSLTGNSASRAGGGAYGGILNNCWFTGNSASEKGGGACGGTLNNCTLTGNSAGWEGGGASSNTLNNCILYFNSGPNYHSATLNYCCTTPLPTNGVGNVDVDPELASAFHLSATSPCRGAGSTAYAIGVDVDGEAWLDPPSIGCDEYRPEGITGDLSVAISSLRTNLVAGFALDLAAEISGRVSASVWDFGDGTILSNRVFVSHTWGAGGEYWVTLRAYNATHPDGVSATTAVSTTPRAVHYVSAASTNPVPPYTGWATAAGVIQDAVDAATPGDEVLVTNGVYATGGRALFVDEVMMQWGTSNRVAVTKPLTLRSVNGPEATVIEGYQPAGTTNQEAAIRCLYLASGAVLSGFTLTKGDGVPWDYCGGGVYCESTNAMVTNCLITANSGGGAYRGTLNHCTLTGNGAFSGGGASGSILNYCALTGNSGGNGAGAYGCTLYYCTLTDNWGCDYGGGASISTLNHCVLTGNQACEFGGGAFGGTLNNCILTGNSAPAGGGGGACGDFMGNVTLNNCILTGNSGGNGAGVWRATLNHCTVTHNLGIGVSDGVLNNCIVYDNTGGNYYYGSFNYSCTTPLPTNGFGNIDAEPELTSAFRLSADSPCRGAGSSAYTSGADIDGEPWLDPPSIGCDEYRAESITGDLSVAISVLRTNLPVGISLDLTAEVGGRASAIVWDFGDGTVLSNRPYASHAWSAPSNYLVTLRAYNASHPDGVSSTVAICTAPRTVHYVSATSTSPMPPYTSWATAAKVIQDAVDAADPVDEILVTNGVYAIGGLVITNGYEITTTNRVAVTKPLTVRSVNGPEVTLIRGYLVPGTGWGDAAVRCVYLADGAVLNGFTLTNGAAARYFRGSGVRCQSTNVVVTNCIITANASGGAEGGTLNQCTLTGNWEYGGASRSILNHCTLMGNSASSGGGGADGSILNHCTLMGNSARYGGGASLSMLNHCVLTGNQARDFGGGADRGTLNHCVLMGNSAPDGAGAFDATLNHCTVTRNSGIGVSRGIVNNCIVYHNTSSNYWRGASFNYCCTTPFPTDGIGNITNEPAFVDLAGGDLRLRPDSPCINAGNNAYVSGPTDLDGNPRIAGGTVDIGAYEFQTPTSLLSYAWAQRYGLPTDGSADFTDHDTDLLNNWQEWRAGTVPTDTLSVLRLLTPVSDGTKLVVTWESVTGRSYFLERAPDLSSASAFTRFATNISGQTNTTSFLDTNVVGASPRFYRVGVE